MRWAILLLSIWTSLMMMSFDVSNLDAVRTNYSKMVSDKDLCKRTIAELENLKNPSATHIAYLGAAQSIWANHIFSPLSKLKTFNKGKENIEKAIKMEPFDIELRFIRLSIQKKCTFFFRL